MKVSLQRLQDFIYRLQNVHAGQGRGEVRAHLDKAYQAFCHALAD